MPVKKRQASTESLTPPPVEPRETVNKRRKAPKASVPEPTDEFQQVTKPDFVDRYRMRELSSGGDVYYQSDVCTSLPSVRCALRTAELMSLVHKRRGVWGVVQGDAGARYLSVMSETFKRFKLLVDPAYANRV